MSDDEEVLFGVVPSEGEVHLIVDKLGGGDLEELASMSTTQARMLAKLMIRAADEADALAVPMQKH